MANNRKYDLIWKEGSWFEKGKWEFKPQKSLSEKGLETVVVYFILGSILLLLLGIIILTLPIWSVLIGLQMVREKRYIVGIISLCSLIYFLIDINNQWLTSLIFNGFYNDDGIFVSGLFSLKSLNIIKNVNFVFAGLGIGYIFDSILISKYGRKFKDNRITAPQVVIYLMPMFVCYLISNSRNIKAEQPKLNEEIVVSNTNNSITTVNNDIVTQVENIVDSVNYNSVNYTSRDIEVENKELSASNTDLPNVNSQYILLELVDENKPDTWYVREKKTSNYGMVNKLGEITLPTEYSRRFNYYLNCYTGKVYAVGVKNGKYGILDIDNKIIMNFIYYDVNVSSCLGYVCLKDENEKWGLIDTNKDSTEKILIDFKYDKLKLLYKGKKCDGIFAQINNFWGYIDLNDNIIIDFNYTSSDALYDKIKAL